MKNLLLSTIVLLFVISEVKAVEPAITITTSSPLGTEMPFGMRTKTDNTSINIDWGNGVLTNYIIGTAGVDFTGILTGNTIKIYGTGIELFGSNAKLTTMDLSGAPDLLYLYVINNELTSINLSKNINLHTFVCRGNKFTTLDFTKNTDLVWTELEDNLLTSINVSNLTKLERLSFGNNKVTTIDISSNILLNYFDCNNNLLITLDVTNNPLINFLNCGKNPLTSIDISKNTNVEIFYCYRTALTTLDVSKNIKLTHLGFYMTSITNIDLSNNTELVYLQCFSNTLSGLNLTKNTKLDHLECFSANLTTLDLSKNTLLTILYCQSNLLTSLDLSNNNILYEVHCYSNKLAELKLAEYSLLEYLYCNDNLMTTLDVSKNLILRVLNCNSNKLSSLVLPESPKLLNIKCNDNKLTSIDVSKNPGLSWFRCNRNYLSSLDLTANPLILILECSGNRFSIPTLSLKAPTWTTYLYSPQQLLNLPKKQYGLSEDIDLSGQYSREGNTTSYTWKTASGSSLIPGNDYTSSNGVFNFHNAQSDSVYCQMINATFPDLILETRKISVSITTGMKENMYKTEIYPNPVKDVLNIRSDEPVQKVEIFSGSGVKLLEIKVNRNNSVTIPADNLPRGLLIAKILINNKVIVVKVLKE